MINQFVLTFKSFFPKTDVSRVEGLGFRVWGSGFRDLLAEEGVARGFQV